MSQTAGSDLLSEKYDFSKRKVFENLATAITFKTVNYGHGKLEEEHIKELHAFLEERYPKVHNSPFITKEVVNELSLLYHVKGSDESLKPYMFCAHMDVVPTVDDEWEVPPFEGRIQDGLIWGRGTIDCKDLVLGTMEALEYLLESDFKPQRSFYLAFGHDEESGGYNGACEISKLLKARNVALEYILDEGPFVLEDSIPGVDIPVALVGISEKGSLDLELSMHGTSGHSSVPPKETIIVRLSKTLAKLNRDIFPEKFGKGTEKEFFEALAPYAKFPYNIVYSNTWFFKPFIVWKMNDLPLGSEMRTTTAVTVVSGGTKQNVIPSSASGYVNHRIHPSQTVTEVFNFMKDLVNDSEVEMKNTSSFEAHPISPTSTLGYINIDNAIRKIIGECCVAPTTNPANTDTRWYLGLSKSIYRFSIVRMKENEMSRFHGNNELITESNYLNVIYFYVELMKNSDH